MLDWRGENCSRLWLHPVPLTNQSKIPPLSVLITPHWCTDSSVWLSAGSVVLWWGARNRQTAAQFLQCFFFPVRLSVRITLKHILFHMRMKSPALFFSPLPFSFSPSCFSISFLISLSLFCPHVCCPGPLTAETNSCVWNNLARGRCQSGCRPQRLIVFGSKVNTN